MTEQTIPEETVSEEVAPTEAAAPQVMPEKAGHEQALNNSDDALSDHIQIEVVYGLPHKQELLTLSVERGTCVEDAIKVSGIINTFAEIDLSVNKVGIWNRAVKLSQVLEDLDRIEIYRPLIADPKEVRKRRAEKAIEEGRADKVTGGRVNPQRT